MNGSLVRSSRLPQALFFRQKKRSWHFVTCISFVEVFPAAAGAFFAAKKRSLDFVTCDKLLMACIQGFEGVKHYALSASPWWARIARIPHHILKVLDIKQLSGCINICKCIARTFVQSA